MFKHLQMGNKIVTMNQPNAGRICKQVAGKICTFRSHLISRQKSLSCNLPAGMMHLTGLMEMINSPQSVYTVKINIHIVFLWQTALTLHYNL